MVSLSYSETIARRRPRGFSLRTSHRARLGNWRLAVALGLNALAWTAIYLVMHQLA